MKGGFRNIGSRKLKLIEGPLSQALAALERKGINGFAYMQKRYGIRQMEDFMKIKTKRISGLISDLRELR